MFYAKINEENICIGISQLRGAVESDTMVALEQYDISLLGKQYQNGEWVEIPQPEPQPAPLSNIDQAILETAVNTEYLVTLRDLTL